MTIQTSPAEPLLWDAHAPALAKLSLSEDQRQALARQGFVSCEYREQRGPFFKLRFRCAGRQVVRYLGQDGPFAEQVRQELWALQMERHAEIELAHLTAAARQLLRQAKHELLGAVDAAGFRFHGQAIRAKARTS